MYLCKQCRRSVERLSNAGLCAECGEQNMIENVRRLAKRADDGGMKDRQRRHADTEQDRAAGSAQT